MGPGFFKMRFIFIWVDRTGFFIGFVRESSENITCYELYGLFKDLIGIKEVLDSYWLI